MTGNRTNLSETINGASRSYAWKFDALYRLTNEVVSGASPTGNLGYGYNPVGNRTNRSGSLGSLGTQNLAYNTNDWLTTDVYDSNGNTISNASNQPYFYDMQNRLTNFNNGAVIITYNGDGQRVKKTAGGVTTLYLVDDLNPSGYAQVFEELTVSGSTTNLAVAYTYGLDLISQRKPSASTNFFGYDGHGSTRFLLDAGGNVANVFAYDAYGTLIASNAAPQTAYLYCGEQSDSDLGFYYLRARYLNAGTGRFWTMDSFAGNNSNPLSLHQYLYAANNPANQVDPSGHMGIDVYMSFHWSFNFSVRMGSFGSKCGPDVTDSVKKTLADVETTFLSPGISDEQRRRSCMALYTRVPGLSNPENAWEIGPLGVLGGRGLPRRHYPPGFTDNDFGSGSCEGTVVYKGDVVWGGALNYIVFGKMNKLCSDKFSQQPFTMVVNVPGLGTTYRVSWSEDDVFWAVSYHKWNARGGLLLNPEAKAAFDFAEEGYTGSNPKNFRHGPRFCSKRNVKTWPSVPMMWKWTGIRSNE